MATLFDKYNDDVDKTSIPTRKHLCKAERERILRKKKMRAMKALIKALRKQNKLLEQEAERRKAEEAAAAEAARLKAEEEAKEADKRKSGRGVRGFLTKLGDAICRAVPKVLTTLATLAFSWFVKNKLDRRVPQAA